MYITLRRKIGYALWVAVYFPAANPLDGCCQEGKAFVYFCLERSLKREVQRVMWPEDRPYPLGGLMIPDRVEGDRISSCLTPANAVWQQGVWGAATSMLIYNPIST